MNQYCVFFTFYCTIVLFVAGNAGEVCAVLCLDKKKVAKVKWKPPSSKKKESLQQSCDMQYVAAQCYHCSYITIESTLESNSMCFLTFYTMFLVS